MNRHSAPPVHKCRPLRIGPFNRFYPEGMAGTGGNLFAVRSVINYHASAHFDEFLDICVRAEKLGNSSMTFEMGIFRDGERLISGEIVYVNVEPESKTSRPLPDKLRKAIEAWEAGGAPG